jgi:drug/metabolite transporter (DMT)-like permease
VLITNTVQLSVVVIMALVRSEHFPPLRDLIWGVVACLLGIIGLGALLRGFAIGRMGIVAPVSAVLATGLPVVFASFSEGLPRQIQMLGFGLALVSIWLLSRPEKFGGTPAGLGMALLAGLGFGGFFIALDQIGEGALFWPLAAGRLIASVLMVVFALSTRRPLFLPGSPLGLLVLAGLSSVGGDLFFLLAVQSGRLDIAAVLGSLYPVVTTVLAKLITRENMARLQVVGMVIAILAIVLITI